MAEIAGDLCSLGGGEPLCFVSSAEVSLSYTLRLRNVVEVRKSSLVSLDDLAMLLAGRMMRNALSGVPERALSTSVCSCARRNGY